MRLHDKGKFSSNPFLQNPWTPRSGSKRAVVRPCIGISPRWANKRDTATEAVAESVDAGTNESVCPVIPDIISGALTDLLRACRVAEVW
jgi:hypothetical protein